MQEIHGHEIIKLIKSLPITTNKSGVISAIITEFGEESRYHNCSTNGFTASELVAFFEMKGKLLFDESGFSFGNATGCKH